jgi:hypothetical protein
LVLKISRASFGAKIGRLLLTMSRDFSFKHPHLLFNLHITGTGHDLALRENSRMSNVVSLTAYNTMNFCGEELTWISATPTAISLSFYFKLSQLYELVTKVYVTSMLTIQEIFVTDH